MFFEQIVEVDTMMEQLTALEKRINTLTEWPSD